jgi:hypothetical protein
MLAAVVETQKMALLEQAELAAVVMVVLVQILVRLELPILVAEAVAGVIHLLAEVLAVPVS